MTKVASISLLCLAACAPRAIPAGGETARDEVFTRYTPLSMSAEIGRRTLTPLTFAAGQTALRERKEELRDQTIDLSNELFSIFVPGGAPPAAGYGLLVFVAPWPDPTRVHAWQPALVRHGLIFVSAANSGNEASVLDRRLPLALLGWENVRAKFPVNPDRVYVGGLSGGSRVAEIAALGWPDVFRGALLNAGSEPIGGENGVYLPPADLFRRFQGTRLVYVTGDHDAENVQTDRLSRDSMHEWCVEDIEIVTAHKLGHEPLDPISMERALDALERRHPAPAGDLARCNERIASGLRTAVSEVETALARGDRRLARARLLDLDRRFAGLAAAEILALDAKIKAGG